MTGRTYAALAVALVLVLTCAAAGVSGQDVPPDPTDPTGNESNASDEPKEIYDELHDLTVRSVEYADGQFTITVEWSGEGSELISFTEMVEIDSSGSTSISIQQQRIQPGEPVELKIAAEKRSSGVAAVMLSTQQSIERGDALLIQSGEPTTRDPVPFNLAALGTILSALIGVGVSIALVVRRKRSEDRGKERIA